MAWSILANGEAKIDVSSFISGMEAELRRGAAPATRAQILAALRRWEQDEMLDEVSRTKARALALEFPRLVPDSGCFAAQPTGTVAHLSVDLGRQAARIP